MKRNLILLSMVLLFGFTHFVSANKLKGWILKYHESLVDMEYSLFHSPKSNTFLYIIYKRPTIYQSRHVILKNQALQEILFSSFLDQLSEGRYQISNLGSAVKQGESMVFKTKREILIPMSVFKKMNHSSNEVSFEFKQSQNDIFIHTLKFMMGDEILEMSFANSSYYELVKDQKSLSVINYISDIFDLDLEEFSLIFSKLKTVQTGTTF